MRYLIISDIHSNIEALDAVLDDIKNELIDKYLFLGDAVGYAANPNKVIARLRSLDPLVAIRGNHDKVVTGFENGYNFRESALKSALWARRKLVGKNMTFLQQLPKGPVIVDELLCISHGSPADENFYIFGIHDARKVLDKSKQWITFYGHTHYPIVFHKKEHYTAFHKPGLTGARFQLERDRKYLINPGSVGQSRDRNPRSSYAILDTDEDILDILRIEYDIKSAQKTIKAAGLPRANAVRLEIGR